MRNIVKLVNVALVGLLVLTAPMGAAEINFVGLPAGTVVFQVSTGLGVTGALSGTIQVFGFNPAFGPGTNAAIIFDSSNPTGGDTDLGTPNETFGGPGIGVGGEMGQPFENGQALFNILIIAEDLVDSNTDGLIDDPDDADLPGEFLDFDFSTTKVNGKGTVTVNSFTLIDQELEEGVLGTFIVLSGPKITTSMITVPVTGDNGVVVIDGIDLEGVANLRLILNGSAGIASVVINEDEPGVCWITTGGFQNAGTQSGGKDFTFGGNVGPPPSGSWEVIDHNTGDNFHTNDVHIVECLSTGTTGPQQPGGKKGFTIDKATFEGTGRLNGVDGFPFTGFVIDGGEPAGKKGNDKDFFEIVVRDPITNAIVFEASGELDGGNVQIHPPNPSL